MSNTVHLHYDVPGDDFTCAGEASSNLKNKLKQIGFSSDVIRRVSIAVYEAEINMVIHANGGVIDVDIDSDSIEIVFKDQGPGIADVALAMKEGYSTAPDTIRSLGFGAGMGLPNIKKYTDYMDIQSVVGEGTTVTMRINTKS